MLLSALNEELSKPPFIHDSLVVSVTVEQLFPPPNYFALRSLLEKELPVVFTLSISDKSVNLFLVPNKA